MAFTSMLRFSLLVQKEKNSEDQKSLRFNLVGDFSFFVKKFLLYTSKECFFFSILPPC